MNKKSLIFAISLRSDIFVFRLWTPCDPELNLVCLMSPTPKALSSRRNKQVEFNLQRRLPQKVCNLSDT